MRASDRWRLFQTSIRTAIAGIWTLLSGRERGPQMALAVGDEAPDFTLPASDGHTYRLRDFRGHLPVVLAWFPRAFTSGCTVECRSIQASRPDLDAQHIRYFAISTDAVGTNRQFAASLGVDYPILSDTDGSVARAYGVMGPAGFPSRWTFYIDRQGLIADVDKAVKVSSHGRTIATRAAELGLTRPIQ